MDTRGAFLVVDRVDVHPCTTCTVSAPRPPQGQGSDCQSHPGAARAAGGWEGFLTASAAAAATSPRAARAQRSALRQAPRPAAGVSAGASLTCPGDVSLSAAGHSNEAVGCFHYLDPHFLSSLA